MTNDLGIVFKIYLISLGLQLLVWPWIGKLFEKLNDKGWALGRVIGALAISLPIWFMGHVWPVNTDVGVGVVILLLVLVGLRALQKRNHFIKIESLKLILMEEGLFLTGLMGLSLIRGFQPSILGLEKFMDFGFIKQYLVSSNLPVNDMWLAGKDINYYSFGHFLTSILIRVWGVGLGTGYNLMLAWILGTSLALSFSIVVNLGGGMIGSVMGALLTCLGGNSHLIWYLFKNKNTADYWYADATRFIENTIHEFPGYSFVVSDLHAHVLGLPIVLAFILILVVLSRTLQSAHKRLGVTLGVLMGVMAMTNTWDVAIYGLLMIVLGLTWLMNKKVSTWQLSKSGLIVAVAMGATALPWLLSFKSFSNGIGLVETRSPLWQLGVLWGGHLVVTAIAIFMVFRGTTRFLPKRGLILALGITALLLLIIPEILYIKDIYPTYPRANTMFKLTYQAFIIMSLLSGWAIGQLRRTASLLGPAYHLLLMIAMVVLWGGLMLFPVQSFDSYYRGFKEYKELDGLGWLKKDQDKWAIIEYLEDNRDGKNLIEAVGDSYSTFNDVSAFSGTPTVLGWKVHEWLWRGGYSVVRERSKLVKNFYEQGDESVLEGLNIGWVMVGSDERKTYQMDEGKLLKLGEVVWSGRESYLIKID